MSHRQSEKKKSLRVKYFAIITLERVVPADILAAARMGWVGFTRLM